MDPKPQLTKRIGDPALAAQPLTVRKGLHLRR
jgi:hypothetical protein